MLRFEARATFRPQIVPFSKINLEEGINLAGRERINNLFSKVGWTISLIIRSVLVGNRHISPRLFHATAAHIWPVIAALSRYRYSDGTYQPRYRVSRVRWLPLTRAQEPPAIFVADFSLRALSRRRADTAIVDLHEDVVVKGRLTSGRCWFNVDATNGRNILVNPPFRQ